MYAGLRTNITALIILYSLNLLGIPKSKVLYQILQKASVNYTCLCTPYPTKISEA